MNSTRSDLLIEIENNTEYRISLITYCYILPTICAIGLFGNIINLLVLISLPKIFQYFKALAITDILCMIFALIFSLIEILREFHIFNINRSLTIAYYQTHFMLPLINWTLSNSIYVVVMLSIERCISIMFPIKYRSIHRSHNYSYIYVLIIYILTAIIYMPYAMLRYTIQRGTEERNYNSFSNNFSSDDNNNTNSDNVETIELYTTVDSETSETLNYQIYEWCRELILRLLPIIVVSLLNINIIRAFHVRGKLLQRRSRRDEKFMYIILMIISFMFIICNVPAALNILFINETLKKRFDYQIFRATANLLEISNHSLQFYIFCICSCDYRRAFLKKLKFLSTFNLYSMSTAGCRSNTSLPQTNVEINRLTNNYGTKIFSIDTDRNNDSVVDIVQNTCDSSLLNTKFNPNLPQHNSHLERHELCEEIDYIDDYQSFSDSANEL